MLETIPDSFDIEEKKSPLEKTLQKPALHKNIQEFKNEFSYKVTSNTLTSKGFHQNMNQTNNMQLTLKRKIRMKNDLFRR